MWNADNLDAPSQSLLYLAESAKRLKDALHIGFAMGIKIAKFNLTKNLKDYRVTMERTAMATEWDEVRLAA
jgi:hypothetical protein